MPVAALSACFGILLVGVFVFMYLYMRTARKIHLATLMVVLPGIFFVGSDIACLILRAMNETGAVLQMRRAQSLSVVLFLFTVPFFFGYFLDIGPLWRKINRVIMYAGLLVFAAITAVAFISPDLYLSVTKLRAGSLTGYMAPGRGEYGILLHVVDIMLLVMMAYSVCCIVFDYMKRKRDICLAYVFAGVIAGMLCAVYDILFFHGVIRWHVGPHGYYSFSGFGFTIFLTLSMAEVLRQFLNQGRELERAKKLESLGIFAGGIAHDFNNYLTSIMGSISIVKKNMDKKSHEYLLLDDAERASGRAHDLIQQMLTFSQGGAPVLTAVSIGGLLRETTDFVLRGSDVRSEYSLAPELWDICADRSQITQVIYNVIMNARQAMAHGGLVAVMAENYIKKTGPGDEHSRRYVRVRVQDSGDGISKRHLRDIFVPYFTTKKDGSGLGLAVARSIISRHGGEIRVHSRDGGGTTVEFYVPASPKAAVKEETAVGGAVGGRILFMDDDAIICEVSSEMLKLLGYDVECASSGEEAVELYKQAHERGESFDCVIMDLTIPGGMDGSETVTVLREFDPHCRAIVSSGYSDDPVMANYREYGFVGICPKPYSVDVLEAVLADVLKA